MMHLIDQPGTNLPSVEGILVASRSSEFVIALPVLHVAVGANPKALESRELVIPRERVAFYEVLA